MKTFKLDYNCKSLMTPQVDRVMFAGDIVVFEGQARPNNVMTTSKFAYLSAHRLEAGLPLIGVNRHNGAYSVRHQSEIVQESSQSLRVFEMFARDWEIEQGTGGQAFIYDITANSFKLVQELEKVFLGWASRSSQSPSLQVFQPSRLTQL